MGILDNWVFGMGILDNNWVFLYVE